MNGLSVRGLTVERARRLVLEDISFSAPAGMVTAVLGMAGAGKTSLLAAIAGLLPLTRGAVFRGAQEVTRLPEHGRGVGFLVPGTVLPQARTLRAALQRLAGRRGAAGADNRIGQLGLSHLAGRPVSLLSHGEQALALTAARLASYGHVLLVDEAGAGLDDAACRNLVAVLRTMAVGGRPVLLATRLPAVALAADHLVLLGAGQVLQAGRPASLYAEPRDGQAARLAGPANILTGAVRELRPGGFVWAGGSRHIQAASVEVPRPALGSPVSLCLRPERIALLAADAAADNVADGTILDVRSAGPLLDVLADTRLGTLQVAVPSWGATPYPAAGQPARLGWAADAAHVLN